MQKIEIPPGEVDALYEKLKKAASDGGYFLNPDAEFAKAIITGLLVNEKRYGYISCPCRIAEGIKEKDLDIICPCDYRDQDIAEYGACHCGLHVSRAIAEGKEKLKPVPERRMAKTQPSDAGGTEIKKLAYPVWRCKVCGYICARNGPPEICPVCKAEKERFERFI